jgi:hypothetical protein
MFHISGLILIRASLALADVVVAVSDVLEIPPFQRDETGRVTDEDVPEAYLTRCFGLEFAVWPRPNRPAGEFGLSVGPDTDVVRFEGDEPQVDATKYTLHLLKRAPELKASIIDRWTGEEVSAR